MKQILFAVAMLFGILAVSAQQYDEVDLLGTWIVTAQTGEISNTVKSFEKITFGEMSFFEYQYNADQDTWNYPSNWLTPTGVIYKTVSWYKRYQNDIFRTVPTREVTDYLITDGNKLHIQFGDYTIFYMRFVIKKMTETEIILENYTGTCELTLTKEGASRVKDEKAEEVTGEKEYYSINGMRVGNPEKGMYIKKEGLKVEKILK